MWNVVFDALLSKFDEGPSKAEGFADYAALVIKGPDIPSLLDKGQEAINMATSFGKENVLEFDAKKTIVVMFTRRRFDLTQMRKPRMGNFPLHLSREAKYLGVTLDSGLTFGPQVIGRATSAKRLLFRVKGTALHLYGPTPVVTWWVYTSIETQSGFSQRPGARSTRDVFELLARLELTSLNSNSPKVIRSPP